MLGRQPCHRNGPFYYLSGLVTPLLMLQDYEPPNTKLKHVALVELRSLKLCLGIEGAAYWWSNFLP